MKERSSYEKVKEFHTLFDKPVNNAPAPLAPEDAQKRAAFLTEEVLEFLYASAGGDLSAFDRSIAEWKESAEEVVLKIKEEQKEVPSRLIGQVDALTDANYFNYGTFVLMGVDPGPIFDIVHQANMGKLFPDGKPRYRKLDGKVMKPGNWERDFSPEPKIKAEIEKQMKLKNEDFAE